MPLVRPFRGLHYALERYGSSRVPVRVRLPEEPGRHPGRVADLTDLVCPPFDVITPALRERLLERDPHNAARLELSAADDPHAAAASDLRAWRSSGVLGRSEAAGFYYYSHAVPRAPDDPAVHAVAARVLLEPFGDGIRAHEGTMAGPKADRLGLLRATRTQLSPILAIYFDRSQRYPYVMSRPWTDEWRARDEAGLLHALAAVEPDDRLAAYLSGQELFIADGHHRYETALAYQAEVRADGRLAHRPPGSLACDWVLMVLVNAELEELEIQATHRLLRNVDAAALQALVVDTDPLFQAIALAPDQLAQRMASMAGAAAPVFGLALPGGEGYLLVGDPDGVAARMRREPLSSAVQRLDVAVLHGAILGERLGLDPVADAGERILYTVDAADALDRVRSGEVQAAILLRPTRLEQLAAVARANDVMPQKSTYFYPKLLTGMVFNPVEDDET